MKPAAPKTEPPPSTQLRIAVSTNSSINISFASAILLALAVAASAANPPARWDYILPSWGDIVCSYGPGVSPALDCPEAFEQMIKHWQGRGLRGVYLRTDLAQLDPATFRRNPNQNQESPGLAVLWKYIDEVTARFDVFKTGNTISEKNGFEFWAWHAHMFSDGAPENVGGPGVQRIWPWSYVVNYTFEHPEALTTDRTQTKHQWMVREYGYPEARATKVAEFVYMAKALGIKRFIVENRSEASQMQDPPDNADRFGFNDIVVKDMKAKYGVDILTDPRFDVDSPKFNSLDPMVENWHRLRGDYFTQFFRDLRKALNEVNSDIKICASLAGERIGPPMGNWFTDWRTWVDEGLIDALVSSCNFDAYPTSEKILSTFLTCTKQSRGILPFTVFKDYIMKSRHPEVKIISSGGSLFHPNLSIGSNGGRMGDWYHSYQMAWYQRWGQLMKDVDELGHINFFEQSFDDFPVNSEYFSGGYGNKGYVPALRACPGVWSRMGPANGTLPSVQSEVHYGKSGNAVKLTSDPTRSTDLAAFHSSTADRALYYTCIEPAILNGKAEFDFRIYRDSDASAMTACLQDRSDSKRDIGVRVAGDTGELSYSKAGTWETSGVTIPKQVWNQVRISVDFAKQAYSAALVSDGEKKICGDVPYMPPGIRLVSAGDGSTNLVELPAHKMFNHVDFAPEGKAGSITYLDDVIVRWVPDIPYVKPARNVLFADDFERFKPGSQPLKKRPQIGKQWTLKKGEVKQGVIENQASYGEGVKSLRLQGDAELACGLADNRSSVFQNRIVWDLDLFVRSDSIHVKIMPSSRAGTEHTINPVVLGKSGNELLGLKNINGHWAYLESGEYKGSSMPVALDCWNHVQIIVDKPGQSYKIIVQPVGEMPTVLASGRLSGEMAALMPEFIIKTSNRTDAFVAREKQETALINFSCIDNIRVTAE